MARAARRGASVDLRSLRGIARRHAGQLAGVGHARAEPARSRVPYEGVEEPFFDLGQGRTDAVLLDDIIVARYGPDRGLRVVADVGARHATRSPCARDEPALPTRARSPRSRHMVASGELRRDPRALALDSADGCRCERQASQRTPPRRLDAAADLPVRASFTLSAHQLCAVRARAPAVTLLISTCAMLLAVPLGLLLAVARLPSPLRWRRIVRGLAAAYVELFRGTPVLLQLYVLYYGLAPRARARRRSPAAILGLGLNYAAYEAEILPRAASQAVPRGQIEAALALGMIGTAGASTHRPAASAAVRAARGGQRLHRAAQGQLARVR